MLRLYFKRRQYLITTSIYHMFLMLKLNVIEMMNVFIKDRTENATLK